ncbi:hypothetical protein KDA11_05590, partial [Candidatus Saccharibacteria bacterium]|nr:hypothetical protein [Candidatus Saccharibacteria bacterium]
METLHVNPELRVARINKFNFIDKPYVELRGLILEAMQKKKYPMAPFWHGGALYTSKEDITRLIDTPLVFYHHNVVSATAEVEEVIRDAKVQFTVNYCTHEETEPT